MAGPGKAGISASLAPLDQIAPLARALLSVNDRSVRLARILLSSPSGRAAMKTPDTRGASADWQPWFAWYPPLINGQPVWLQTVLRRPEYCVNDGLPKLFWVYQVAEVGRGTRATER